MLAVVLYIPSDILLSTSLFFFFFFFFFFLREKEPPTYEAKIYFLFIFSFLKLLPRISSVLKLLQYSLAVVECAAVWTCEKKALATFY